VPTLLSGGWSSPNARDQANVAVVQGLRDAQKEVEMVSSYALDDGAPNSLVSPPLLRAQASSAECSRPRVDEGRAGGFSVRGVRESARPDRLHQSAAAWLSFGCGVGKRVSAHKRRSSPLLCDHDRTRSSLLIVAWL
jgi:hypothetical protein